MFYITSTGNRIQTPLEQLLKSSGPTPVYASAASRAISENADGGSPDSNQTSPPPRRHPKTRQQGYEKNADLPPAPAVFAEQIMSQPLQCLSVQHSATDARQFFEQHDCHHLPILDQAGQLAGIISDRDLLRRQQSPQQTLQALMSSPVICASRDTEIRAIAELMCQRGFSALPILEQQQPIGIVSRTDILRAVINHAPLELWT